MATQAFPFDSTFLVENPLSTDDWFSRTMSPQSTKSGVVLSDAQIVVPCVNIKFPLDQTAVAMPWVYETPAVAD